MCMEPPFPLATPPMRPEQSRQNTVSATRTRRTRVGRRLARLTCELGQDLSDGDTAGVGVAVCSVRRDQVIRWVDGGFDSGSARFLWAEMTLLQHPEPL